MWANTRAPFSVLCFRHATKFLRKYLMNRVRIFQGQRESNEHPVDLLVGRRFIIGEEP